MGGTERRAAAGRGRCNNEHMRAQHEHIRKIINNERSSGPYDTLMFPPSLLARPHHTHGR